MRRRWPRISSPLGVLPGRNKDRPCPKADNPKVSTRSATPNARRVTARAVESALLVPCDREKLLKAAVRQWSKFYTHDAPEWTSSICRCTSLESILGRKKPLTHVMDAISQAYPRGHRDQGAVGGMARPVEGRSGSASTANAGASVREHLTHEPIRALLETKMWHSRLDLSRQAAIDMDHCALRRPGDLVCALRSLSADPAARTPSRTICPNLRYLRADEHF